MLFWWLHSAPRGEVKLPKLMVVDLTCNAKDSENYLLFITMVHLRVMYALQVHLLQLLEEAVQLKYMHNAMNLRGSHIVCHTKLQLLMR